MREEFLQCHGSNGGGSVPRLLQPLISRTTLGKWWPFNPSRNLSSFLVPERAFQFHHGTDKKVSIPINLLELWISSHMQVITF